MSVVLCNIPCTRREVEGYGSENVPDIEEQGLIGMLDFYVGSDCWAIASGRDRHYILHYENWTYYEKYGDCHGNDGARYFYKDEDLRRWDEGDYIDVYFYGSSTKKVRFIKIRNELWTREYFKSSR